MLTKFETGSNDLVIDMTDQCGVSGELVYNLKQPKNAIETLGHSVEKSYFDLNSAILTLFGHFPTRMHMLGTAKRFPRIVLG
jgi:hypothetical protein